MSRTHNQKGCTRKCRGKYVKLDNWLLTSPAWESLKAEPKVIYVELKRRYNGRNNGEIGLSIRQAAEIAKCAKNTASNAFKDLQTKGFIKIATPGGFDYKLRHATEWTLTEYEVGDRSATKDFMSWDKENRGLK